MVVTRMQKSLTDPEFTDFWLFGAGMYQEY
jgi:hypothetical protein